jgi:drug/metabolite transporter (DMT)-like permease
VDVATAVDVPQRRHGAGGGALLCWQLACRWRSAAPPAHAAGHRAADGVQSLCLYAAVARLPVALALLAFNTYPLWTALWARVVYGHRPSRACCWPCR